MRYILAEIPTELARTQTGILWAAANIAVTDPTIDDAIAEAARRVDQHGSDGQQIADALAVDIARSRVPYAPLNPAWPSGQWRTWQAALDEVWPILADAATKASEPADVRIGLVPGRWEV